MPEPTRERVHSHQVTLDQALALSEFADDADAIARLEAALDDHGDLRHAAERKREQRATRTRYARLRGQLLAGGWTLATHSYDVDAPDDVTRLPRPLAFHEIAALPTFQHLTPAERAEVHTGCPHRAAYIWPTAAD